MFKTVCKCLCGVIRYWGTHESDTRSSMARMMTGWLGLLLLTLCVVKVHVKAKDEPKTVDTQLKRVSGKDCTHIKNTLPKAKSGIYTIQPSGVKRKFKVYCEMLKDGGWTVLQRRTGGNVSFSRDWKAYKKGFGGHKNDHWLGLTKIWALTNKKNATLRVDLWDFEGGSAFAQYQDFRLGNEKSRYKLHVGAYSGNAGDAIRGAYDGMDQNGFGFSTLDRDNDGCSPCILGDIAFNDCSDRNGGGWWFSRCGSANLHGEWHPKTKNRSWASGLHWGTWKENYSAKATHMMIKTV